MKKKSILVPLALTLLLASCTDNGSSLNESSSNETPISSDSSSESSESSSSADSSSESSESSSSADTSKVENVKFVVKTVNVDLGSTAQLKWKIYPSTAVNTNVTFTIADTTIASVDSEGVVSGLSVGQTTVTIKTEDGDFTDTATINVIGQQATKIKLIVPEGTLQDENGAYLLKVDQTLQLSYTLTPANSVNRVTYSTQDSSGSDVKSYLRISEDGYLKARKVKVGITVSVTTDNLCTDSVTFSVVKDSIYANEFLKQKLKASTAIEKEKVVSGTLKKTHVKSSTDEEMTDVFNIYTNGVSRTYTEVDNYLNTTTNYDGFYGIYNNKFYQLERNGNKYTISSSVKDIGAEITLEDAQKQSSLAYYKTRYGFADIINNECLSTSYFGRTGDWYSYSFTEKNNVVKIEASYLNSYSTYLVKSTYRVLSLQITFTSEGMASAFKFTCYDYNTSDYDSESKTLSSSATPVEKTIYEFSQTTGKRTENSSFVIEPSQCYYTSLNVKVYNSIDSSTDLKVGDYLKFEAENYSPKTATSSIDKIEYVSSSNENVVTKTNGGLRPVGEGSATLTFKTSGGLTVTTDVTVTYEALESLTISTANAIGVKVGEKIDGISVSASPYNANSAATISIIEGNDKATLTYDEAKGTYSLTGVAKGKVTLKATSTYDPSISTTKTLYVYEEITADDVLSTLLANKYKTTYGDKDYILVFSENGKGKIVDGFAELSSTLCTFDYSVEGFVAKVSNFTGLADQYIRALEDLTLNKNGLEITGKMQTGSSTNSKKNYTFTAYE